MSIAEPDKTARPLRLRRMLALLIIATILLGAGGAGGFWYANRHMKMMMSMSAAAPMTASSAKDPAANTAERKALYWYDPMYPTQKFDKPGKSPFMDMELVPRYADGDTESSPSSPNTNDGPNLALSNHATQALGLRLAEVELATPATFATFANTVDVVGTIMFSERDISMVQAKTAGFVERVYARAVGDIIAAGSPLADVLNPEWAGAQQEYLVLKQIGDLPLQRAAYQRLQLLGMSAAQIERVEQRGQPIAINTITAPNSGVITELMVRQGMTLAAGMSLAKINSLATVWLELAVPEAQAALVAQGQTVQAKLPALGNTVINGKVTAILPETNRDTRTLRVRVELPNPGQRLRAGMFAQARLQGMASSGKTGGQMGHMAQMAQMGQMAQSTTLIVPSEAVIRTGKRAIVYLALEGGRYQPVEVEVGAERDDKLEILSGLQAGQKVVASGQFLLDSEASLRGIVPVPTAEKMGTMPPAPPAQKSQQP